MLITVPHQTEALEKSSKGTIIRRAVETRFEAYIDSVYGSREEEQEESVQDEMLPQHLIGLVQSIAPNPVPLKEDADIFSYGVDSIACMRLRDCLRRLTPKYNQELPLSVVEDCGTVRGLSEYIIRKRRGNPDIHAEDEERLMLDLVKQFSLFGEQESGPQNPTDGHHTKGEPAEVVVFPGATGALGAHILELLRKSNTVAAVYCLVRGADEGAAKGRVSKALEQRGLDGLGRGSRMNYKIHESKHNSANLD